MTGSGRTSSPAQQNPADVAPGSDAAAVDSGEATDPAPGAVAPEPVATSPALARAAKLNAANMARSMLPLVIICLLLVGWAALRQPDDDPVRTIDPTSSVRTSAERADYGLLVPQGLGEDYRPTSARTDAGAAQDGDPVTLEIGFVTPEDEFAGFIISDDLDAQPLRAVLDDAEEQGTVRAGGEAWTRLTTARDETALTREADGATVVVFGSASDEELTEVAAAVQPYRG